MYALGDCVQHLKICHARITSATRSKVTEMPRIQYLTVSENGILMSPAVDRCPTGAGKSINTTISVHLHVGYTNHCKTEGQIT